MSSEAERQFHRAMVLGVARLKREISYNATRFMEMVGELGGAEAARQLLRGRDASDGFTTLWEHGRLEMSVEAFVLLPWYRELFTEEQLETAERRLREHRFDVERFLRACTQSPPSWVASDPTQAG
ncbi:hypothetical protein [Actinokineospora enzanensis]|uniref:hypothetical protein n=1 Tax=Actinokineospora enzanensis TaxID=155975 RepID=UPI0003717542|nr:hypothetical protein [Actinokineospora enzanensis]